MLELAFGEGDAGARLWCRGDLMRGGGLLLAAYVGSLERSSYACKYERLALIAPLTAALSLSAQKSKLEKLLPRARPAEQQRGDRRASLGAGELELDGSTCERCTLGAKRKSVRIQQRRLSSQSSDGAHCHAHRLTSFAVSFSLQSASHIARQR